MRLRGYGTDIFLPLAPCRLPLAWLRVAHFSSVALLAVKLNAPVENRQGYEAKG